MKKIFLSTMLLGILCYGYYKFGGKEIFPTLFESNVTIEQIKSNPSKYVNLEIELEDVAVVNTSNLLNYSISTIRDKTGSMILVSNTPYRKGEIISVEGHYKVLYGDGNKSYDVFVARDFHPVKDLLKHLKETLLV